MEAFYRISSKSPLNPKLNCSLHTCGCRLSNFIWVSERLKIVYFETPKCGCSSIKIALDIGGITPLQFATAYLVHSQNYCSEQDSASGTLAIVQGSYGARISPDAFVDVSLLAASNCVESLSEPVGRFGFMHFFGSPEQAIAMFPDYRKFVVFRDPFDHLLSSWNMFYNSNRFSLEDRLLQCKTANKEKQSFRYFAENIWTCPNHHFDRLVIFVPAEVLAEGVEMVLFEDLRSYWEDIKHEYGMPVGLQIMGKPNSEAQLLRVADAFLRSRER